MNRQALITGGHMDIHHLKSLISQLEHERRMHDEKFAENPAHGDCMPRFDIALSKLREEVRAHGGEPDGQPEEFARGDELKPAEELKDQALALEEEAREIKEKASKIVATELNELDGFPR